MSKQELIEKAVNIFNGKWPSKSDLCVYMYKFESENIWECGSSSFDSLFTREEFNAAADRMRGNPDWKDAPEWAQWLGQCFSGNWEWYQKKPSADNDCFDHGTGRGCQSGARGKVIGDWRNTLEKRPEHIGGTNEKVDPAPAKPWFEAGDAPPAGTYCQVKQRNEFINCYIVGLDDCGAIVYRIDGFYDAKMDQNSFRPIKTDKEKFIDAADKAIDDFDKSKFIGNELLSALFDAGFRAPDQK